MAKYRMNNAVMNACDSYAGVAEINTMVINQSIFFQRSTWNIKFKTVIIMALAAIGAALGGQALGGIFQGAQNRKSRRFSREMYNRSWQDQTQFSREMYGRQYQDSVRQYEREKADQIAFWNMQNSYNQPSAEMNRLKAAGLNPALMYGSGAQANRAGDVGKPSFSRPSAMGAKGSALPGQFRSSFDPQSMILAYNQTRIADKQMELLDAEKASKLASAFRDTWSGNVSKFEFDLKEESRAMLLEQILAETTSKEARASLDKMQNQVQYELFSSGKSLKAALADVVYKQLRNENLQVQRSEILRKIENLNLDAQLKEMEKALRSSTGQTYGTGTLIGPILRLIYSGYQGLKSFEAPTINFTPKLK